MSVRLLPATLATACACLVPGHAVAQDRSASAPLVRGPAGISRIGLDAPEPAPAPLAEERQRAAPSGLLQSWDVGVGAELGLGRYRVGEIARSRTHTEKVRSLTDRDNRAIAGAGFRLSF